MASRLSFDFDLGPRRARRLPDDETTQVLVIADLSGEARAGAAGLESARVVRVDVDNFESFLRSLRPKVTVASGGVEQCLAFESIADFHPDALYDALEVVAALRRGELPVAAKKALSAEPSSQVVDHRSEFERLLQGPASLAAPQTSPSRSALDPTPARTPPRTSGALDQMLRELVAPHVAREPTPAEQRAGGSRADAIRDALRGVLHAPAFQRLEAAWRALRWLVFENALGHALQVHVLDASRADLVADLRACQGELERSQLYRRVAQPRIGAEASPFALVIADVSCAGSDEDVSLLAGLGAVAARAGGCLLAGAEPPLWGCQDLFDQPERGAWTALPDDLAARMALLRGSAVAPFIGLCMPRVLGRIPYGERSDPIERCDFEELRTDPAHSDFLWINSAFACAQLILSEVAERGWGHGFGAQLDLGDMPHAKYRAAGGDAVKACAEVHLDESSAAQALACGLMPFMSYRNRNAVRLMRLQSIASAPTALALAASTRNG
jgi:type VI secretion system protein ImpC